MRNLDSIEAWKAFLLTVKTGNISQTAILMDMGISKVSLLVSGLEDELGYKLLDRSVRPFKPTRQAELLIPIAIPLVKGFEELINSSKNGFKQTLIRISSPIEIAQEFYSAKLIAYSKTHTNVVFEMATEAPAEALFSGNVDVAVVNRRLVNESNLVVRPFMQTSTPVLCTPEYLRRNGVPKKLEDLKDHTGLIQKTYSHISTQCLYNRGMESPALKWRNVFYTHDQLMIKRLVLNHQGITPDLYFGHCIEEIKNGDLVPILPGWEREPWVMSIVTRQDRELENSVLRTFAMWWAQSESESAMERVTAGRKVIDEAIAKSATLFA